ncbi:putative quinol monooxygenase [Duganella violaceipulchra]|uniref:Antibiotic biosynthesis monooxygenase n=1 Tax=Duganella violaceipulchra TaxID=2849652 RepID=A0AA41HKV4_9BURK|nr:antibiotic biosynthesis monooxygenase [Duganella violaceicalia]MBV6325688.1 antibiotic biosynthesis monooxygenase [Duganella violaceicalia]MCP2012809.1 quinol monooxygenase YgiN [Duganella violaceicalia]
MSRLTFIVHLPARANRYAELEAGVRQVLRDMSREPDFLDCTLHRAQNDCNTLVVYESWKCTREYFLEQYLPRQYRADFERELPGCLAAPRRIEFLDEVDPPLRLRAGENHETLPTEGRRN